MGETINGKEIHTRTFEGHEHIPLDKVTELIDVDEEKITDDRVHRWTEPPMFAVKVEEQVRYVIGDCTQCGGDMDIPVEHYEPEDEKNQFCSIGCNNEFYNPDEQ